MWLFSLTEKRLNQELKCWWRHCSKRRGRGPPKKKKMFPPLWSTFASRSRDLRYVRPMTIQFPVSPHKAAFQPFNPFNLRAAQLGWAWHYSLCSFHVGASSDFTRGTEPFQNPARLPMAGGEEKGRGDKAPLVNEMSKEKEIRGLQFFTSSLLKCSQHTDRRKWTNN